MAMGRNEPMTHSEKRPKHLPQFSFVILLDSPFLGFFFVPPQLGAGAKFTKTNLLNGYP